MKSSCSLHLIDLLTVLTYSLSVNLTIFKRFKIFVTKIRGSQEICSPAQSVRRNFSPQSAHHHIVAFHAGNIKNARKHSKNWTHSFDTSETV